MSWWNSSYPLRRKLTLNSAFQDAAVGDLAAVNLDVIALLDSGKIREDYEDIEVIHQTEDATPSYIVLARDVTDDRIYFATEDAIGKGESLSDAYYIYYSNTELVNQPERPVYEEDLWPFEIEFNNAGISYTRPDEHWVDGVSTTTGAVTTFEFTGEAVRAVSYIGSDQGIAEFSLDSGLWEDIDLFSVIPLFEQTVYEKLDLLPAAHKLQVKVSGRAHPSSQGIGVNVAHFDYLSLVNGLDLGEEVDDTIVWSSSVSGAN